MKEIFVIEDGINIYHYTTNHSSTNIDPVLSSGFFSALQSFTHTRSSEINSYSSESEIVIFKKISNTNKNLVAIFSSKSEESYAEYMLNRIEKIFSKSKIMFQMNIDVTDSAEGHKIKKRIEKLLKLSTSQKAQIELANKLYETSKLDVLILYDIKKRKSVLRKHEIDIPKSFANWLIKLDKALDDLVLQLNLGPGYNLVTIEGDKKLISIFKSGTKVVFSQGNLKTVDYLKLPLNINGYTDIDDFLYEFDYLTEVTKWKMDQSNSFNVIRGNSPNWRAEQSLVVIVQELSMFTKNLNDDLYFKMQIYLTNPKHTQIAIQRQFTLKSHEFTIFQEI